MRPVYQRRARKVTRSFVRQAVCEALESRQLLSATVLKDINPLYWPEMGEAAGTIFLSASDAEHGNELWKTDGTPDGTVLIKDINPGAGGSDPYNFVDYKGELYFTATDGSTAAELWKSDGTAGGTLLVSSVPRSDGAALGKLAVAGNTLYWDVEDMGVFTETSTLYTTDGTSSSLTQIGRYDGESLPSFSNLTVVDDKLYFVVDVPHHEVVGSSQSINLPFTRSRYCSLISYHDRLFIAARGYENPNYHVTGSGLWSTDGTTAATQLFNQGFPSLGDTYNYRFGPDHLTLAGDSLYFTADDILWRTDGTTSGTISVPTPLESISTLFGLNRALYVVADDGVSGSELWKSDGTAAGTGLVMDINPGAAGSDPGNFTQVGPWLFFTANGADGSTQIYATQGSADSTVQLTRFQGTYSGDWSMHYFGNSLYFAPFDYSGSAKLWQYHVSTLQMTSSSASPAVGDTITFTANFSDPADVASGEVTFRDGTTILGTSAIDGSGHATFVTSNLACGKHQITASLASDASIVAIPGSTQVNVVAGVLSQPTVATTIGTPGAVQTLIPVTDHRAMIYDSSRHYVYVTTSTGLIQRYDAVHRKLLAPIKVKPSGSLVGADITPDCKWLYVADGGKPLVYKINLATAVVTRIKLPNQKYGGPAEDLCIDSRGKAMTEGCSYAENGGNGLLRYNLATGRISQGIKWPLVTDSATLYHSGDRSHLLIADHDTYGGLATFDATTNSIFPFPDDVSTSTVLHAAMNTSGSICAVSTSAAVTIYDGYWDAITIFSMHSAAVAFSPAGDLLFVAAANSSTITAYDTQSWVARYVMDLGEPYKPGSGDLASYSNGVMTFSSDGRYLFFSTSYGIRMLDLRGSSSVVASTQDLFLQASVGLTGSPDGSATGDISFVDDTTGTTLASAPVQAGVASVILHGLAPGKHVIRAVYSGDFGFLAASSPSVAETATAPVSVKLACDGYAKIGDTVTLRAAVSKDAGSSYTPGGSVTFRSGDKVLGTAKLVKGVAVFKTDANAVGRYTLSCQYNGDAHSSPARSASIVVAVTFPTVIDFMALYTSEVIQEYDTETKLRRAIVQAVDATNQAFINSRIPVTLRLVYMGNEKYVETGNIETDWKRLSTPDDGRMDDVQSLRTRYGADLVSLFVTDRDESLRGVGSELLSHSFAGDANAAYSVVVANWAGRPDFVLAHELGHNLGAAHEVGNGSEPVFSADAHGYRFIARGTTYHDIMSYDPGTTIPSFSNPAVDYLGVPTGNVETANSARVISMNAPIVANYFPTKVSWKKPPLTA